MIGALFRSLRLNATRAVAVVLCLAVVKPAVVSAQDPTDSERFDAARLRWEAAAVDSPEEFDAARDLREMVRGFLGRQRVEAYLGYLEAPFNSDEEHRLFAQAVGAHDDLRAGPIEEMLSAYAYVGAWHELTEPDRVQVQTLAIAQNVTDADRRDREEQRSAPLLSADARTAAVDSVFEVWAEAPIGSATEADAARGLQSMINGILGSEALGAFGAYLIAPLSSPEESEALQRFLDALPEGVSLGRAEELAGIYTFTGTIGGFELEGISQSQPPAPSSGLWGRWAELPPVKAASLLSIGFKPVATQPVQNRTTGSGGDLRGVVIELQSSDTVTMARTISFTGVLKNTSGSKIEVPKEEVAVYIPLELRGDLSIADRRVPAEFETERQLSPCTFAPDKECFRIENESELELSWRAELNSDTGAAGYWTSLSLLDRTSQSWRAEANYYSIGLVSSKEAANTGSNVLLVIKAGWAQVLPLGALGALLALIFQIKVGRTKLSPKKVKALRQVGWAAFSAVALAVVVLWVGMIDSELRFVPLAVDRPIAAVFAGIIIQMGGWGAYGDFIRKLLEGMDPPAPTPDPLPAGD